MITTGVKLEISPDLVEKLGQERVFWTAAHSDGSENKINEDAVWDAANADASLGILTAAALWVRKLWRGRGKTQEDRAAEREAAGINRSCGSLEAMLLEYVRSAQGGEIDGENLDELIDELEEMHGFLQAGKLTVTDGAGVAAIRSAVAAYTAAIARTRSTAPVPEPPAVGDEFSRIRALLLQQKALLPSS